MYKNHEGYSDPTAGIAVARMLKEYKKTQKEIWKKQYNIKHRLKVYVISKYSSGDVQNNVKAAIGYCRYVIEHNGIPIASHLLYPQMLHDEDPKERELWTLFGLSLLADSHEAWCFGTEISTGMAAEIMEAKKLKIPIRYFTEEVLHGDSSARHY